jgi:hypothetical protein
VSLRGREVKKRADKWARREGVEPKKLKPQAGDESLTRPFGIGLEPVTGIEPACPPWEVRPTRTFRAGGAVGTAQRVTSLTVDHLG